MSEVDSKRAHRIIIPFTRGEIRWLRAEAQRRTRAFRVTHSVASVVRSAVDAAMSEGQHKVEG